MPGKRLDPHFPGRAGVAKPAEVRMGKGKGTPEYWAARVKPGRIMFEIDGVPRRCRARGLRAGGGEAADQDQVRHVVTREWARRRRDDESRRDVAPRRRRAEGRALLKLKKEQFNLRFPAASGQLENTARVRQVRRDIARIKTVLRERQAAAPPVTE